MKKNPQTIYFSTRDELAKVCLMDVVYIVSDDNYVEFKLRSGRAVILLASLQSIEQMVKYVPEIHFERVGRSHIINLRYLAHVDSRKRTILLADDTTQETFTVSVPKDAVRHLKELFLSKSTATIPNFNTTNGKMEAFVAKHDSDS